MAGVPGPILFYGALASSGLLYVLGQVLFSARKSGNTRLLTRTNALLLVRRFPVLLLTLGSATLISVAGIVARELLTPPISVDVVSAGPGGPATCYRHDTANVYSKRGYVAIVRSAYCPSHDVFDSGVEFYVVFVHTVRENNASSNVVLQYAPPLPDATPDATPAPHPRIIWTSDSSLDITVPGTVEQVIVKRKQIDDIEISYHFLQSTGR